MLWSTPFTREATVKIRSARTGLRWVALSFGLLMLTVAGYSRAGCNYADLPFGFNVTTFTYSTAGGNYAVGANGFQYAYPSAAASFGSACNASLGVGNGYAKYAYKPGYLSLWAFPAPFTGTQQGYELTQSQTLFLLINSASPPPDSGVWVGAGQNYATAPMPPLSTLPNGTWYLTIFEFDATTGLYWTYGNVAMPIVIGAPPPPPPPPTEITPQIGLWWNPNESGSGYAFDVKHGVLVATIYSYTAAGPPIWYLANGAITNNSVTAALQKYTGGQCISCAYKAPLVNGSDGSVTITFTSETSATMTLPGRAPFQIVPQAF
jgi:hypothetical protein